MTFSLTNKNFLVSCFIFLLCSSAITLYGQQQFYPAPLIRENASFTSWLDIATRNQLALLSSFPPKQRDYIRTAFEQRREFLNSLLKSGQLMFGTEIHKKVHQAFATIEAANPAVKGIATEFVLINSSVNAVNMGGGCILVCTG
jgi:hypothetical protein